MGLSRLRHLVWPTLILMLACGGGGSSAPTPPPPPIPTISSVNPSHGGPGATVALTGTNLSQATAVSFNGHPAFVFSTASATEVDAVVPGNATSGSIQVTTPYGTAASPTYTVDAALVPGITSFTPTSLTDGSVVTLTGTHFVGTTLVRFNGVNAATFQVTSDTQIQATAPAGLTAGTISVSTPGGTAVSAASYTLAYGAPTITGVNPTQGPIGAPVVITGTNLGYPGTTLTLNGLAIPTFTQSANQISFSVPSNATSGNLVITTPGGSASHAFTVSSGTSTLDLHIDKLQLTQSTQTLDNTVPIVAGKSGLIRVFVLANEANSVAPSVQVTLLNNGAGVAGYPKTIAAPTASVPTALSEGTLASSWNLIVPATDLTTPLGSGYSIHAVVDPNSTVLESDKTNNAMTVTLAGTTVPTFKTTIFPVVLSSGTGNITDGNKAAWVARLAKMYPVAGVDVAVGPAFTGSISSLTNDSTQWSQLLSDLATKHQADGVSDRYYYGAIKVSYSNGIAGMGYVPGSSSSSFQYRTALGWDKSSGYNDGGLFPEVFSHETGHNMGRQHSPCGTASSPDPNYPYAGGLIGVWGYDSVLNQLYSPLTYKDIMGYCTPNWVSDYVYKSILTFRGGAGGFIKIAAEDATLPKAQAVAQECLIVRGIVYANGKVELLPSFRTWALPSAIPDTGELTLECLDQQGVSLFTAPVEPVELGCGPNGQDRHFILALALPSTLLDSIAGLNILKQGQILSRRRPPSTAARLLAISPSIRRLGTDQVRLTWDASTHPTVMVRDSDSGEVIAILSGGSQNLATQARRFDLILSDGVTGPTQHLEAVN